MEKQCDINIYCDESCHLEHDGHKSMVIGAMWCPKDVARKHFKSIREIKKKHGLHPVCEVKWTKVSPSKLSFYEDLVDFFFNTKELFFRAIIIPDKSVLDHVSYNQSHNEWYYKMFYYLLNPLLNIGSTYNIYMDIKDTNSAEKQNELRKVLSRGRNDFEMKMINKIQVVHSHEVELVQLTDIFSGALCYYARGLSTSKAKQSIVSRIERNCNYPLKYNRPRNELKLNLLYWQSQNR